MANAIILRRKIKTAKNISKTTKAMQMIAASKLRRAQEAALSSRPYAEKLVSVIQSITKRLEAGVNHPFLTGNQVAKKDLYIIVASDKGLSGGLTANLTREVYRQIKGKDVTFITLGKKIEAPVARLKQDILGAFTIGNRVPNFSAVLPVIEIVKEKYLAGEIKNVYIVYTQFVNVFSQVPKTLKLLPVSIEEKKEEGLQALELIEPSTEEIIPDLLQHYIEMLLYQYLLESFASQQAAQMTAMQNATNNANDIIDELTLAYNKSRQEKITSEILDIGGAQVALL